MFGNDFPQGNTGQLRYGTLSNFISVQAASDPKRPRSGLKACSGQYYKSNGHWVRRCGAPYKGLRLWAVPQGKGPRPKGLRDLISYTSPPLDLCSAPENKSRMTKAGDSSGSPIVNH